tara:strand:- start:219 stop:656 length:438 start_codon:yes stop_codon:yes gene_type:complete
MSTKTIVAGTEVSLIDLTKNEDHPAHITLEIKKPKPELVDLTEPLIKEVRQDPWEQTDTYTLEEFKSWYGDYIGEMAWDIAKLNELKDKLSKCEDQQRKFKNRLRKIRRKHKKQLEKLSYETAFAQYEAEEAKYHNHMAMKQKTH